MTAYTDLGIWAQELEDMQKLRIASANRIGRGTKGCETNAAKTVDADFYQAHLEALEREEHVVALAMRRCYRRSVDPAIVAWQKATPGIGEHLLARLLGVIGDPVHTTRHHWEGNGDGRVLVDDGPYERRVSDLWSYCGHGDATRKRRKGMDKDEAAALGSDQAKMLTRLLAVSCMRCRQSPYRAVYDARRALTVDRFDTEDWTPLHQHNDALRLTGKAILRDLWLVSSWRPDWGVIV
jgi:hypothetical protein